MSRWGVRLMRLLAVLPLPVLRGLGRGVGLALYALAGRRRRVGLINLRLCFPQATPAQHRAWLRAHFVAFSQAWLDRAWLWHAPAPVLAKRLHWCGQPEQLDEAVPTVVFAPHFVGLDAGWTALTQRVNRPLATIYTPQRDAVVDAWMLAGRGRFGDVRVCRREDGLQGIRSVLRQNGVLYLLPDLNHGAQESVFVPFFGHDAATVPSLSRLARVGRARVVPMVCRLTADGYALEVLPAWGNFPTDDAWADTARMNQELQTWVSERVTQYHWLHQRFKSRPDGGASPYEAGASE